MPPKTIRLFGWKAVGKPIGNCVFAVWVKTPAELAASIMEFEKLYRLDMITSG